ncbi:MAG: UDP-glucose dehydrogenase family protein [Actinomycetota bacterium]
MPAPHPLSVAIIGTGYVGLVTGACLAAAGHRVTCVDTDAARIGRINAGDCPIFEPGLPGLLRDGLASGRLAATVETAVAVDGADVVMIAVGTPSKAGAIQLDAVEAAVAAVGAAIRHHPGYPVVAVKSTVVPGTTEGVVRRQLERWAGRTAGHDLGLAMNPEFLSQGSAVADFMRPDRIVVGSFDARSAEVMAQLYAPFPAPLLAMTLAEAELAKYAANALQATLISFANQFAGLCEAIPGADHARVMASVHLDRMLDGPDGSRAGATRFLAGGIGFGGSCFPKDLAALSWWARRQGVDMPLVDATLAVNTQRPERVVDLLAAAIGGLWEKRVTVLGLTFKPGTDDLRESPALKLVGRLLARGVEVRAHDPLPEARARARELHDTAVLVAETPEAALGGTDAAIIATAWPDYAGWEWPRLAALMRTPVVLDGRGLFAKGAPAPVRLLHIGSTPVTEAP